MVTNSIFLIKWEGVANGIDGWYMSTSLQNLSTFWKKPMIFTEIGFCSGDCIYGPNVDVLSQVYRYESGRYFEFYKRFNIQFSKLLEICIGLKEFTGGIGYVTILF